MQVQAGADAGEQDLRLNPKPLKIDHGTIHVWKVRLCSSHAELRELPGLLSAAEGERAGRFAFEKDHARFVSCRASLRIILGRYTGVAPEKLAFRYEAQGKPALEGLAGWQFNLSHSRDLAAIAISRNDPVGIDLELIDADFPRDDVAPDILTADELREMDARPFIDQSEYFFQLWTLKEALLKALGRGLSLEPRDIHVHLDAGLNPDLFTGPPDFMNATLRRLNLEAGYAAALAVLAPVAPIPNIAFFSL
jgi:4'-phosphopantetheinyl transferase